MAAQKKRDLSPEIVSYFKWKLPFISSFGIVCKSRRNTQHNYVHIRQNGLSLFLSSTVDVITYVQLAGPSTFSRV
jgi:hypothetical protein